MIIYPPCKICGQSNFTNVEEDSEGNLQPFDICEDCMFKEYINYVDEYSEDYSIKEVL